MRKIHTKAVKRGDVCEQWKTLGACVPGVEHDIGMPPTLFHTLAVLGVWDGEDLEQCGLDYIWQLRPRNIAWWSKLEGYVCGLPQAGAGVRCSRTFGDVIDLRVHRRAEHPDV